jgi:dihydroceramidase
MQHSKHYSGLYWSYQLIKAKVEKRFSVLHLSNMALAIGSMLFHATLQHVQQQSDETPMVWEMLLYIYVLYSPDWHYTYTMPTFLFLYGAAFATLHSLFRFDLGFKIHYIILALLCLPRMYKYYIHTTEPAAKRLAHLFILTVILGGVCWLLDRTFCDTFSTWYINPQGHALWHIFMGFNAYFANAFLQFCRAQQLQWNPEIRHVLGLPYVKIFKVKRE